MRLLEMDTRHQLGCGKATIDFSDTLDNDEPAIRNGDRIILRGTDLVAEFFLFKSAPLFLFATIVGREDISVWFGGTDEQPFLVRLDAVALKGFMRNGENAFLDSLIPGKVKAISETVQNPVVRQGDMIGTSIAKSWKDVEKAFETTSFLTNEKRFKLCLNTNTNMRMFDTRHTINGDLARIKNSSGNTLRGIIVLGKLEAPDHAPQVWDTPHFVQQTNFLYNPKNAD